MASVIFLVFMVGVAWVFFILPQQRRMRAHQALVSHLDVADEVMTTSGVLGSIVALDEEIVQLEVAPGVVLRVVRGAIARRITEPEPEPEPLPEALEADSTLLPPPPATPDEQLDELAANGEDIAVTAADGEPADSDT
jgi:preprotein translocase subunit YajC